MRDIAEHVPRAALGRSPERLTASTAKWLRVPAGSGERREDFVEALEGTAHTLDPTGKVQVTGLGGGVRDEYAGSRVPGPLGKRHSRQRRRSGCALDGLAPD